MKEALYDAEREKTQDKLKAAAAAVDAEQAAIVKEFDELDKEFEKMDRATQHLSKYKPDDETMKQVQELKLDDLDEEDPGLDPEFDNIFNRIVHIKESYEKTLELFNQCDEHVADIISSFSQYERFQHDKEAQKEVDKIMAEACKGIDGLMTPSFDEDLEAKDEYKVENVPESSEISRKAAVPESKPPSSVRRPPPRSTSRTTSRRPRPGRS